MGSVFRKTITGPIPATATVSRAKGKTIATWRKRNGRTESAEVATLPDGREVIEGLCSRPRVRLDHNGSIVPFDPASPPSRGVSARKRVGADLVNVVATRLARADRVPNRLDLVDVDDRLLSIAADAVHEIAEEVRKT